jgi:mannosyltransferase
MSAETPTVTSRRTVIAISAALAVAVVLRFLAFSALWLDEAQTVAIARRPLPQLFDALRLDGSPPLFYLLLHGWMSLFGSGDFAVRSLAGVISVATLPLAWLVARRLGADRWLAWATVLLFAANPFAIRYATETRMYSLVVFLWLAAFLALARWWTDGSWWAGGLGALAVAALVLTHYWSLFAVAAVGSGAVIIAVRGDRRGWRLLAALAVGCLGLLPWASSFLFQLRHTGAPWGSPPSVGKTLDAPTDWAGSGPLGSGTLLALVYYALLAIAVAGVASDGGIRLTRSWRRTAVVLVGIAFGTMLVGTAVSGALSSAYAPRYSAVALAPFLLAVAWGLAVLQPPWRTRLLAAVVVIGLVIGAGYPGKTRSQADEVATALSAATPQDTVVFCPDQLGPAVHRLAPDAGHQVVYPTMGSPAMVDWVDYADRNAAADPAAFAHDVVAAASPSGHIWLVYAPDYPTFDDDCTSLVIDLALLRGTPYEVVASKKGAGEKERVVRFPTAR